MKTAVLSALVQLIEADAIPLTVALLPRTEIWHLALKSRGYTSIESARGTLGRAVRKGLIEALPVMAPVTCSNEPCQTIHHRMPALVDCNFGRSFFHVGVRVGQYFKC